MKLKLSYTIYSDHSLLFPKSSQIPPTAPPTKLLLNSTSLLSLSLSLFPAFPPSSLSFSLPFLPLSLSFPSFPPFFLLKTNRQTN